MGANTSIEWATHTFNPWWGCSEVSPGCDNCYARRWAHRVHPTLKLWGKDSRRLVFDKPQHWNAPLGWNRKAERAGIRARVFCASMADVFDNIEGVDDERAELWSLIHKTPHLDWLLLTKRVGNVARMVHEPWMRGDWPKNAWLGASIVNQEEADRDIPKLLALPAPIRFLSIEPMLEEIDITEHLWGRATPCPGCPKCADGDCGWERRRDLPGEPLLHWVIGGFESGPNARPGNPEWAWSLRDQCDESGTPFFWKQNGEFAPIDTEPHSAAPIHAFADGMRVQRIGKAAAGRLLDGVEHNGFPEVA